jgi:CheY-like chemotaxis protein
MPEDHNSGFLISPDKREGNDADEPKSAEAQGKITRLWDEIAEMADSLRGKLAKPLDKKSEDVSVGSESATGELRQREEREAILKNSLIYIVDNEPAMTRAIERLLKMSGFKNTRLFYDGDEVFPVIFSDDGTYHEIPDLVITDTEMKRVGGLALYERLKTIPDALRPAIIAVSGGNDQQKSWSKEEVSFIPKPFDRGIMEISVDRVLRERLARKNQK